jgi:hypothetical protein
MMQMLRGSQERTFGPSTGKDGDPQQQPCTRFLVVSALPVAAKAAVLSKTHQVSIPAAAPHVIRSVTPAGNSEL